MLAHIRTSHIKVVYVELKRDEAFPVSGQKWMGIVVSGAVVRYRDAAIEARFDPGDFIGLDSFILMVCAL